MPPLRIAIYGSECTGKTTLTHQLAEHFQCPHAEEFVREFYDKKGYDPEFADLNPIAKGQIANENAAERESDSLVLFDASLLSTVVYAHHYYGLCPEWINQEAMVRKCDLYLLCDIDLPWESDSQRDRQDQRGEMHALFIESLVTRGLRFRLVSGEGDARLQCACEAVQSLIGSA